MTTQNAENFRVPSDHFTELVRLAQAERVEPRHARVDWRVLQHNDRWPVGHFRKFGIQPFALIGVHNATDFAVDQRIQCDDAQRMVLDGVVQEAAIARQICMKVAEISTMRS